MTAAERDTLRREVDKAVRERNKRAGRVPTPRWRHKGIPGHCCLCGRPAVKRRRYCSAHTWAEPLLKEAA